jgi:hypothetical protein
MRPLPTIFTAIFLNPNAAFSDPHDKQSSCDILTGTPVILTFDVVPMGQPSSQVHFIPTTTQVDWLNHRSHTNYSCRGPQGSCQTPHFFWRWNNLKSGREAVRVEITFLEDGGLKFWRIF